MTNQELAFDVDVSQLPCGLNGALYFVGMDKDGGMSKYSTNKAGAKYGTGYCDGQCPRDLKFINGVVSSRFAMNISAQAAKLRCRPTLRDGRHHPTISMRVSAATVPAGKPTQKHFAQTSYTNSNPAPRWTSGRPTLSPPPILPTRVL